MSDWQGTQRALALDATTWGQRCVVLAVSVVYRGWAMPVAWVSLPAGPTHAWRRAWWRLLRGLRPAMPPGWTVSVLAERGVYAPWLVRRIGQRGWHPFLRLNLGGSLRPAGAAGWRPLTTCAPRPGTSWRGGGLALTRNQVACTLLARWEEGDKDPWRLLTALPPATSEAGWYGRRAWIEPGFPCTKRAGWQWHRTRRSDPGRAARLWRAVAVATRWLLSVGGAADETVPERTGRDVTALRPGRQQGQRTRRWRLVRILRRGWIALLVAWLRQESLPEGRLVPEPWPAVPPRDEADGQEGMAKLPQAA